MTKPKKEKEEFQFRKGSTRSNASTGLSGSTRPPLAMRIHELRERDPRSSIGLTYSGLNLPKSQTTHFPAVSSTVRSNSNAATLYSKSRAARKAPGGSKVNTAFPMKYRPKIIQYPTGSNVQSQ
jgi:hypothetical protein